MVPDGRLRWIARRVRPETFMLLRAAPRGQTCARRRERLDEPLLGWPGAGIVRKRRNSMRASRFTRQIEQKRVLAARHDLYEGGDVSQGGSGKSSEGIAGVRTRRSGRST